MDHRNVVRDVTVNRVSFNGGEGGITARPSARRLGHHPNAAISGARLGLNPQNPQNYFWA
jgi:hypothetical protein